MSHQQKSQTQLAAKKSCKELYYLLPVSRWRSYSKNNWQRGLNPTCTLNCSGLLAYYYYVFKAFLLLEQYDGFKGRQRRKTQKPRAHLSEQSSDYILVQGSVVSSWGHLIRSTKQNIFIPLPFVLKGFVSNLRGLTAEKWQKWKLIIYCYGTFIHFPGFSCKAISKQLSKQGKTIGGNKKINFPIRPSKVVSNTSVDEKSGLVMRAYGIICLNATLKYFLKLSSNRGLEYYSQTLKSLCLCGKRTRK